jgi:uncharacterized protein (TIGR02186 family)
MRRALLVLALVGPALVGPALIGPALIGQAWAEETIVTGLSDNQIEINANYDGSDIMIYGAVKRDAPPPSPDPMAVIITVEGPSTPLTIRRKEWVAGLWINRSSITVAAAPSFYAVATSGPIKSILTQTEDLRYRITIPHAIRAVGTTTEAPDAQAFIAALERLQESDDRYRLAEWAIQLTDQTLFRTDVQLPADLVEGDYKVRLFLLRSGKVVDSQQRIIGVRKAGLERYLYNMAHEQSLLYGVISLLMAVFAGWAASAGARFIRR